jgi:flagellar export protein FliJ
MKRYEFRLQRILRLKQQRERQAELGQQKATLTLEKARAEAALLAGRLAETAEAIERQIGRSVPPDSWMARYHHAAQIGRALQGAELRVRHAEQRLRDAAVKRAAISIEVEALRTLERQQWDEHVDDANRRAQDDLDEIGLRRWKTAGASSEPPQPSDPPGKE